MLPARREWARQHEATMRRALEESQRLMTELDGPGRAAALARLAALASALHRAAHALDAAESSPGPYAKRR